MRTRQKSGRAIGLVGSVGRFAFITGWAWEACRGSAGVGAGGYLLGAGGCLPCGGAVRSRWVAGRASAVLCAQLRLATFGSSAGRAGIEPLAGTVCAAAAAAAAAVAALVVTRCFDIDQFSGHPTAVW